MTGRTRQPSEGKRNNILIALVALALLLVLARLALPFVVESYVTSRLQQIPEFSGSVGAIRMNLFRGAYEIFDLRLVKTNATIPVPFLTIDQMDLSLDWSQLLRGALVSEIAVDGGELNLINGPTEDKKQTGVDKGWKETLESLVPFTINRFEVKNGVVRYADPHQEPPVDIYVTNLFAVATNLTNVEQKDQALPAGLIATGLAPGQGKLKLHLRMNPLAATPTFKLTSSLVEMDITAINDFLRSYAEVDAVSGRLWIFLNVAAANGRYQGVIKPFFLDLDVIDWDEVGEQNVLQSFWESLVGGVAELFENQPSSQLATRVPIAGELGSGGADLWTTIGGILRNAFLEALKPGVPRPVKLPLDRKR